MTSRDRCGVLAGALGPRPRLPTNIGGCNPTRSESVRPGWNPYPCSRRPRRRGLGHAETGFRRLSGFDADHGTEAMHPTKRTARLAGLLYLLVVLIGPFVLIYAPRKLFVPGDATATASNILAHESLFRAKIVLGLVGELLFISVVLTLYRLLERVSRQLAAIMVILVLI